MLKHFMNPPNWFTSASIFCSFYAILLAAGNTGDAHSLYRAGLLIGFAGVFDMLDGRVARLTGGGSEFGIQLDSLADAIGFGVAPAVLVYAWGLHLLGPFGLAAAYFFALCAVFRLARFNIGTSTGEENSFSKGLTTTMAGGTLAATVMFHAALGRTSVHNAWGPLLLTVVLALLMVSNVPYPVFKAGFSRRAKAMLALMLGSVIAVGVIYDISYIVMPLMATYAASGLFNAALGLGRRRRAATTPLGVAVHSNDDEDEEEDDT